MKKLIPLLVLVIVGAGAWFTLFNKGSQQNAATSNTSDSTIPAPVPPAHMHEQHTQDSASSQTSTDTEASQEEADLLADSRTATEIYKTADEALNAIKNGSAEYDDLILSQFTLPGEECTWCDSLYKSIKDLLAAADTKPEHKSYYSEILAISGRAENISALVEMMKAAKKPEEAEIYAEALELAQGKDDVVNLLGEHMKDADQTLRDASIAAVTNQGTRLAAELLYKEATGTNNPEGHYAQGIGLGELVPTEDALPYLQELAQKRDQYSHLAVKAMLNSGVSGLRLVMDVLTNSKNPEQDRALLKDAIDHVNYEEEVEAYAKKLLETSKQPLVLEFAKSIIDDFAAQAAEVEDTEATDEEELEITDEAPMSKMPGAN